jgi:hypothetical protein
MSDEYEQALLEDFIIANGLDGLARTNADRLKRMSGKEEKLQFEEKLQLEQQLRIKEEERLKLEEQLNLHKEETIRLQTQLNSRSEKTGCYGCAIVMFGFLVAGQFNYLGVEYIKRCQSSQSPSGLSHQR